MAEGTPEKVAENPRSFTGGYLKPLLERGKRAPVTELALALEGEAAE